MADNIPGGNTDPVFEKILNDIDPIVTLGSGRVSEEQIHSVTRGLGYGNLKAAVTSVFGGHNHRGSGNPVPVNNEHQGMTFFTRPRLNLSYDNIKHVRKLTQLLTEDVNSIPRAIRAYLDPDGSREYYPSGLVDPLNPFMPLLDNNIISISGWPDTVVDTYTSKAGRVKDQWSMYDGTSELRGVYSMTASFRNLIKDPISLMLHVWQLYGGAVYNGILTPRPDSILENEIDYQTRAYRLTLDPTRQYVERIACWGAGFPKSDPTGSIFNFSDSAPTIREVDQVSCEFQVMNIEYYDSIIIAEFNKVVQIFNGNMRDGRREKVYTPLAPALKPLFNYMGYPRINPYTSELEWWVPTDVFKRIMSTAVLPDFLLGK